MSDLLIWVVYDHPADLPDYYVARLWIGERASEVALLSPNLMALREVLTAKGLVHLDRTDADDPAILETWL